MTSGWSGRVNVNMFTCVSESAVTLPALIPAHQDLWPNESHREAWGMSKWEKKSLFWAYINLEAHFKPFSSTLLTSVHLFMQIYFKLSGDFTGPSIQKAIIFFSFFSVLCIIHSLIELQCWSVFGFDHWCSL